MKTQIIISVMSILLSGVLSTIISNWYHKKQQRKQIKLNLLDDVFGYRFQMSDGYLGPKTELMRVVNRVPMVFADSSDVIKAYEDMILAINSTSKNRNELVIDRLTTMVKKICIDTGVNSDWNDSYLKTTFMIE